ncbi:MAG: 3-hydroxypropionate dehydrogenase [Archaeoglobi archaeon]|nr:3-hydroxypropionate dehydrogenase [Archaeoglobi archaeon]MDK2781363.1 3-hydroxypropionate dehydrogenase [Archaeoglobi archaeon]
MRIGVVGTGVIASSWSALFLSHGVEVVVLGRSDESLRRASERIESYFDFLRNHGMVKREGELRLTGDIRELKDVDFIEECVSENLELKRKIFSEVEEVCQRETILASSTSGLSITEIQRALKSPERAIVTHPVNPPHLIPLVEIVPGERTEKETVERAKEVMESFSRVPVVLKKEVPGFIVNRLAAALWREAIDLAVKDVVSVEDVDKVVSFGPGLRWAFMGPFMIYHLGGGEGGIRHFIEHLSDAFSQWWSTMECWTELTEEMREKIIKGTEEEVKGKDIRELEKERDEMLVKLLKLRGLI